MGNRLKKAAGFHIVDADNARVILGITGGTGAGKSSALRAIEELGGKVLDCDKIYYELLDSSKEMRDAMTFEFGSVFTPEGKLDRRRLGTLVFSKKDRLSQLNEIVVRFVKPELIRRMEAKPCKLYAIDAINLIESGVSTLCDRTVAVTSPAELRVRRIMARDRIDEQYARLRLNAQKTDDFYRDKCDHELENAAPSPEQFQAQAKIFFEKLIEQIKEEKENGKNEQGPEKTAVLS